MGRVSEFYFLISDFVCSWEGGRGTAWYTILMTKGRSWPASREPVAHGITVSRPLQATVGGSKGRVGNGVGECSEWQWPHGGNV